MLKRVSSGCAIDGRVRPSGGSASRKVGGAGGASGGAAIEGMGTGIPTCGSAAIPCSNAYSESKEPLSLEDVAGLAERLAHTTQERFADRAQMNIGHDQGRFMQMLVEMTGVEAIPAVQFSDDAQVMEPVGLQRFLEELGALAFKRAFGPGWRKTRTLQQRILLSEGHIE